MAGDTVQIGARAFYKSTAPVDNKSATPEDMIASLVQAFAGSEGASDVHSAAQADRLTPFGNFSSNDYQRLKEKDADENKEGKPKAYLNFVLFDDQFNLVDENSGVRQVKATPDELQALAVDKMPIKQTGYLYVYTSNEAAQDVFFDNVILGLTEGPLLEETHYYPFGLTMAGISANALKGSKYPENRKGYNGNELQSKEFGNGSGLELYDFNARTYDQQIGRFIQIDPWIEIGSQEMLTPYQFSYNNPIRYNDPDGKCPQCLVIAVEVVEIGWDLYTAYKIGKTAVAAVSVLQASTINGFQPENGINSPVPIDNTAVAKDIPAGKAPVGTTDLPLPVAGRLDVIEKGDYSHLKEPQKVGPGLETTSAQRKRILEENKRQNDGKLVSDGDGRPLNPPSKSEKGKPADMNQAEVDHKEARSKGGSNSNKNQRVISKEENIKKSDKPLVQ
jgi:RHS repeat-associated protein